MCLCAGKWALASECVCVCPEVCLEPSGKAGRVANPHGWLSRKAIHIYSWLNHILSYRCPALRPGTRIATGQDRNVGLKENCDQSCIYNLLSHCLIQMTQWLKENIQMQMQFTNGINRHFNLLSDSVIPFFQNFVATAVCRKTSCIWNNLLH